MIAIVKQYIPNSLKRSLKRIARNFVDSICYYGVERRGFYKVSLQAGKTARVVFVCKGNVCRSAFAESRLRCLLEPSHLIIDSCGTDVTVGVLPPADSISVAAEFSCLLAGHRSKDFDACDIENADFIFPMEYGQYNRLVQCYPEKKNSIFLLRSFAPFPYCLFCNISDPYGLGENEFRQVYGLINKILKRLGGRC